MTLYQVCVNLYLYIILYGFVCFFVIVSGLRVFKFVYNFISWICVVVLYLCLIVSGLRVYDFVSSLCYFVSGLHVSCV